MILTRDVASPLKINTDGSEIARRNTKRTTQTERIFNLLVEVGRRQLYLGVSEVRISLQAGFDERKGKKMMDNKEARTQKEERRERREGNMKDAERR